MAVSRRTLWLLRALRVQVGAQADDTVRRLTEAWVRAWDLLDAEWQAAMAEVVAAYVTAGRWPAPWQLARIDRLAAAQQQTATALAALTATANTTTAAGAVEVVAATAAAEPAIMASQLPADLAAAALETYAAKVAPSALEAIVSRARTQIHAGTWPLTDDAVQAMRRALIAGVATGAHPTETARQMVDQVQGAFNGGLGRAINLARTETLEAYRHTSATVHAANADVLDGWTWIATLDPRTCFPAGTWIRTRAGQVPIEAVRVGDEVLTHTGGWRCVYETLDQAYEGPMVTVEAGPLRVTATADHPFLIERQGELQWVEARHVRSGDSVLSDRESDPHGIDHAGGEGAVERGSDEPHDGPAEALHVEGLASVPVGDLGVPVRLVNLQGGSAADEEVDRPLPAGDGGLLVIGDAQHVESATDVALGHGLAGVASVAADRAEPGAALLSRTDPERLAAGQAVDHYGGPAAVFRAVCVPGAADAENGAAAGAGSVFDGGAGAVDRTVVVPVGVATRDAERLPATGAGLGDLGRAGVAGARAKGVGLPAAGAEGGAATVAGALDAGHSRSASAPVGFVSLVGGVASGAAELPAAAGDPRRWDLECGSTPLASPLHRHTVSMVTIQNQAARVYNVEVDGDHSYVANGVAVHNCPGCWAMHGTHHPLTQAGPWDHQQGRCARMGKLKSWAELGIPGVEAPDLTPDAEATFAALPHADQLAVMGPGRLALLTSGQIGWADLPTRRDSQAWRPSYVPRPVRELQALAARRAVA
ncbi:Hint domain-containing protein [Micromonospora sp. RP3T]|uniref:Hint domain-containing protein n=1 Tax=Micromonospora sp. RP3T TaxID=2135446 RepID=UPI003D711C56